MSPRTHRRNAGVESILPLELVDLTYIRGGLRLVDRISVRLEGKGRTLILGPNGAGKSLLLRLIHGLLSPTSGAVHWRGEAVSRVAERQAMVFERSVLLRRSVRANVDYALSVRRMARARRRERIDAVLERTGLLGLADRPARLLSAGEQQRLCLARAWSLEPEVLLLDEPTTALDPAAARSIEEVIDDMASLGTKIIMTTHDLAQARRMGDEVLFLHRGALVERTPATQFFDEPESSEARAFLNGERLP